MVRASQSWLIVFVLLLASIFAIAAHAQQTDTASIGNFPPLKSETLEKQAVQLPQDFQGERNLLFIAFERKQQKDIDTWLAQMKRYEDFDKGFRYYEIPTIDKMNRFTRWFINTGMRNGIPDKKARERTITLYIDKEPFKRLLQIPDEKKIYDMVVDRSGNVLWRATGGYDEAKGKSLQEFLEKAAVAHPTSVPASREMGALLCCAAGLRPGANAPSVDHSLGGQGPLQKPKYVSLTSEERWHRYWRDTLLSPSLYSHRLARRWVNRPLIRQKSGVEAGADTAAGQGLSMGSSCLRKPFTNLARLCFTPIHDIFAACAEVDGTGRGTPSSGVFSPTTAAGEQCSTCRSLWEPMEAE
jgi:hypothetical protein